jgi:hypothetical protein
MFSTVHWKDVHKGPQELSFALSTARPQEDEVKKSLSEPQR